MRRVIHGELFDRDGALRPLMANWSSAVRFAYQRFREGLDFNDVRQRVKAQYASLNTRQVSDAVMDARGKHERTKDGGPIIFGGKKAFQDRKEGVITRAEWKAKRDGNLYCRGDATKSGNPNARVVGETLRVTTGPRTFVLLPLVIARKFHQRLQDALASGQAYNVRLKTKGDGKVKVVIDFEVSDPPLVTNPANGAIGVDTNPGCIATAHVSADGNVETTKTVSISRAYSGSRDKADYDLGCLVKALVLDAREQGQPIVAENLKFDKDFTAGGRRWNRIRSNFIWRRFLELLERKCREYGVEFRKVNPAFTSVIGRLKYQPMLRVPIHEAAAYVIGRRGLGSSEKLSRYQISRWRVKNALGRHLEGKAGKRLHSWTAWRVVRGIRPHRTPAEASASPAGPQRGPVACGSVGGNPTGESLPATGRRRR